jgi:hypothetical protein
VLFCCGAQVGDDPRVLPPSESLLNTITGQPLKLAAPGAAPAHGH